MTLVVKSLVIRHPKRYPMVVASYSLKDIQVVEIFGPFAKKQMHDKSGMIMYLAMLAGKEMDIYLYIIYIYIYSLGLGTPP